MFSLSSKKLRPSVPAGKTGLSADARQPGQCDGPRWAVGGLMSGDLAFPRLGNGLALVPAQRLDGQPGVPQIG